MSLVVFVYCLATFKQQPVVWYCTGSKECTWFVKCMITSYRMQILASEMMLWGTPHLLCSLLSVSIDTLVKRHVESKAGSSNTSIIYNYIDFESE